MSAIRQVRIRESDATSAADPEVRAAPAPGRDDLLELLRDAIDRLKSSNGDLPDQTQVASLLAEAGEALERANAISRAVGQCEGFLREAQFEKALEPLDAALLIYPADPALVTRRRNVEEQQQAYQTATTVRTALDEAKWLLDQDRADLALHYLNEKAAELPDQQALLSRLEELEGLLPQWEQKRHVQATLARAATLEQLQQWQAALTILEEALQLYPSSEELIGAVKRVRDGLVDHERQKKMARRLELIGQKIAAQSWRQALTLLENTQKEFPGALELIPLRREVDAGLRRSECEAIVTEVRQCLADGELDQAEQVLLRGLESLGAEPEIEGLLEELSSERKYRQNLREAQVLFGRRQLPEAERILAEIVTHDRPEARALLDAVRGARAATEEESFCERGREKALDLIQQQQFAQAADLLRNLLSLFPGNPILERDLMAAQSGLNQASVEVAAVAEAKVAEALVAETPAAEAPVAAPEIRETRPAPAPTTPKDGKSRKGGPVRESAPSRFRLAAIAGTASLALASATGVVWKLTRSHAPVSRPAATPPVTLPAGARPPVAQEAGGAGTTPGITSSATSPLEAPQKSSPPPPPPGTVSAGPGRAAGPPRTSLREFIPPNTRPESQTQNLALPLPPGTNPIISSSTTSSLPAAFLTPVNAPAPPAAAPAPAPAPAETRPVSGGRFQEAQVINRVQPVYPALARQRGLLGTVKLEATIDERGGVKISKVVSGEPILAAAAQNAVLQWKYKPATLNDRPVTTNVTIQIVFGNPGK